MAMRRVLDTNIILYLLGGKLSFLYDTGGFGWTIGFETDSTGAPPWYFGVYQLDKTFTLYNFDGSVLTSGTWSWCPPTGTLSTGTNAADLAR